MISIRREKLWRCRQGDRGGLEDEQDEEECGYGSDGVSCVSSCSDGMSHDDNDFDDDDSIIDSADELDGDDDLSSDVVGDEPIIIAT